MSVSDLHPEELFDKWLEGELTNGERERLQQHLELCSVCRFEFAARVDFQNEALELSAMAPPPALPLRPIGALSKAERPPARRRSRIWVLGLCAALITVSGVVAAGLGGRRGAWHQLQRFFEPKVQSSQANRRAEPAVVRRKLQTLPEPIPSASALAASPSESSTVPLASSESPAPHVSVAVRTPPRSLAAAAPNSVAPTGGEAARDEGAAEQNENATPEATAAELFAQANQARRARDFVRAAELYRLLQERFPGAVEAKLSRVTLGLLQLDTGHAESALDGFERYLAGPSRVLEAEALVGRARALGRLGRREQEISAWREVLSKYPRSIYGRQASERLAALGQP